VQPFYTLVPLRFSPHTTSKETLHFLHSLHLTALKKPQFPPTSTRYGGADLLKKSTQPIHELEPEPADLAARDRPRLVGLDKPQPDGPGYWATVHGQRCWVRVCPPAGAHAPLTLREKFGAKKSAARHEQRTRLDGTPHHGGHECPQNYKESDQKELESEVRQTRGGWASGWGSDD